MSHDVPVQLCLGVVGEFRDQQAPGSALDERHDAVFRACTVDGVHLPVTDLSPAFGRCRAFGNVPLSSQPSALFMGAVALAVLRSLPQVPPEITSCAFVAPDVLVDRLMADPEQATSGKPAADLFRAEISAQQILDHAPLLCGELAVLASTPSPSIRRFLRPKGPVRAVRVRTVAAHLAVERAAITAEQPRHLGLRERWRLLSQRSQRIPLFGGDLVIAHDDTFLPEDFVSVPDRPSSRELLLHLLLEFAPPNFGVKLARPGFGPAAELPTSLPA